MLQGFNANGSRWSIGKYRTPFLIVTWIRSWLICLRGKNLPWAGLALGTEACLSNNPLVFGGGGEHGLAGFVKAEPTNLGFNLLEESLRCATDPPNLLNRKSWFVGLWRRLSQLLIGVKASRSLKVFGRVWCNEGWHVVLVVVDEPRGWEEETEVPPPDSKRFRTRLTFPVKTIKR